MSGDAITLTPDEVEKVRLARTLLASLPAVGAIAQAYELLGRVAKLEGLSDPGKLETFSMSVDDPRFVSRDDLRFFDGPRRP
jgi:hypothetical protein